MKCRKEYSCQTRLTRGNKGVVPLYLDTKSSKLGGECVHYGTVPPYSDSWRAMMMTYLMWPRYYSNVNYFSSDLKSLRLPGGVIHCINVATETGPVTFMCYAKASTIIYHITMKINAQSQHRRIEVFRLCTVIMCVTSFTGCPPQKTTSQKPPPWSTNRWRLALSNWPKMSSWSHVKHLIQPSNLQNY